MAEFIHPGMFKALTRFFPAKVTIEQPINATGPDGQPVTTWSAVDSLERIGARISPASGTERRGVPLTVTTATHVIELAGAYQGIDSTMRANDGVMVYDIKHVSMDGNGLMTRLEVEVVSL